MVGQLDGGLRLSPQGLRSHKAIEIKRVFPREHVIHRSAQLVREYRERLRFAVFVFEFRKILDSCVLPRWEERSHGWNLLLFGKDLGKDF